VPGPYVQLATICEKVLQEADGVLSVIRAVDRIMVRTSAGDAPAELPEGLLNLTLLVALKSDDTRGRHPITIRIEQPDGARLPDRDVDAMFEGEERGVNLVLTLQIAAIEGLYWFEILVSDVLLTRVPLRVMYQRIPAGA